MGLGKLGINEELTMGLLLTKPYLPTAEFAKGILVGTKLDGEGFEPAKRLGLNADP